MKRVLWLVLIACSLCSPGVHAQAYEWGCALLGSAWNSQIVHLDAGSGCILGNLPASQVAGGLSSSQLSASGSSSGQVLTSTGPSTAPAWSSLPGVAIGAPTSRSLALATAYQATTSGKPAIVTVTLASTASLTLTSGQTNSAIIVIGSTSSVASGTGTTVGSYSNGLTGTLIVGLAVSTSATTPITFALPPGWFFAVLQQTGTVSISSGFDQAVG